MTSRHYDFLTLYAGYRIGLLSWEGICASQDARHYQPCANGCDALGKYRTLDDRDVCEDCYLPVARAELARGHDA